MSSHCDYPVAVLMCLHPWTINKPHFPRKTGLDKSPVCRMQYQASSMIVPAETIQKKKKKKLWYLSVGSMVFCVPYSWLWTSSETKSAWLTNVDSDHRKDTSADLPKMWQIHTNHALQNCANMLALGRKKNTHRNPAVWEFQTVDLSNY